MSFRRYEITLPTRYNDGRPVEPEKFLLTRREIGARLGALTFIPQPVQGEWTHQQTHYDEVNVRIVVDVEDTDENAVFFRDLKEHLKQRFEQIEIWIVSYEIQNRLTQASYSMKRLASGEPFGRAAIHPVEERKNAPYSPRTGSQLFGFAASVRAK